MKIPARLVPPCKAPNSALLALPGGRLSHHLHFRRGAERDPPAGRGQPARDLSGLLNLRHAAAFDQGMIEFTKLIREAVEEATD